MFCRPVLHYHEHKGEWQQAIGFIIANDMAFAHKE